MIDRAIPNVQKSIDFLDRDCFRGFSAIQGLSELLADGIIRLFSPWLLRQKCTPLGIDALKCFHIRSTTSAIDSMDFPAKVSINREFEKGSSRNP